LVGNKSKTDAFINALDASLILETVRSGALGIMRGEKRLQI
jgi:acetolactate synthase-1/3 small subunit